MGPKASNDNPVPSPSQDHQHRLNVEGVNVRLRRAPLELSYRSGETEMSDITREEMNARFEAVEARMDARFVRMDAKLDTILVELRHVGQTATEAKNAASAIKWNVFFAALGGVGITASLVVAFWAVGWRIADIVRPQ